MTSSATLSPARGGGRAGKWAAAILALLCGLWFLALFVGLPHIYSKKVHALMGQPKAVVESALGSPVQTWSAGDFASAPGFPAESKPAGGPVYLYVDSQAKQGYYLFFDSGGSLVGLESSPSR